MPISFPTGPATNDTYTYSGKTWTWTGSVWQANSTPMGPTGPTGASGATGPTGATGPAYSSSVTDVSANYALLAGNANNIVRSTGSAITFTVNNVFSVGQQCDVIQYGTGQVTFAAGTGVTLNSSGGKLKTTGQYSAATVVCVASGIYALIGDISA
jgi:hypothetical protein